MIGSFTVEATLSITNYPFDINPVIFPNPTNNYIHFNYDYTDLNLLFMTFMEN